MTTGVTHYSGKVLVYEIQDNGTIKDPCTHGGRLTPITPGMLEAIQQDIEKQKKKHIPSMHKDMPAAHRHWLGRRFTTEA